MGKSLFLGIVAASLSGAAVNFCEAAAASADGSRGAAARETFVAAVLPAADGDAFAYVTVDEGKTWSFTAPAPFTITAVCSHESTIFAFGTKKIHDEHFLEYAAQSKDGGKTWEQVVQIASSMDSCVATSTTEILAVGYNLGEILQSTNGGASYNRLYKAVEFRERFLSAVAVNGTLLAAGHTYDSDGQLQAELITAPDGAKSREWRNITGPWRGNGGYALNAATACASAVVVGDGTGNIYVSRDPERVHFSESHFLNSTMSIETVSSVGSGDDVFVVQSGDAFGPAILCVSHDAARTFDCSVDLTDTKVRPTGFVGFGNSPDVVFASSSVVTGTPQKSRLFRSSDDGKKWEEVAVAPARP